MIDCFSKHVKIYPVKNATRITATRKLFTDYIPHQGAVEKVIADHGSQFKAPKWRRTLEEAGIKPIRSSIRHPRGNMVERTNKEIGQFLRTLLKAKHSEWAIWIPFIEQCLNNTYHDTIETTPVEAHFNKKPERIWS